MVGPDRGGGGRAARELVLERLGEPLAEGLPRLRAAAPALREDARDGGVLRVGLGEEHGIPLGGTAIDPRGVLEKGAVERAGAPSPSRSARRVLTRPGTGTRANSIRRVAPRHYPSRAGRRFCTALGLSASGLGLRRLVRREHRDEHALLQVGREVGDRVPHSHGELLPARDHDEGDVVVVVLAPAPWRSPSRGSGAAASGSGGRTGFRPRPSRRSRRRTAPRTGLPTEPCRACRSAARSGPAGCSSRGRTASPARPTGSPGEGCRCADTRDSTRRPPPSASPTDFSTKLCRNRTCSPLRLTSTSILWGRSVAPRAVR